MSSLSKIAVEPSPSSELCLIRPHNSHPSHYHSVSCTFSGTSYPSANFACGTGCPNTTNRVPFPIHEQVAARYEKLRSFSTAVPAFFHSACATALCCMSVGIVSIFPHPPFHLNRLQLISILPNSNMPWAKTVICDHSACRTSKATGNAKSAFSNVGSQFEGHGELAWMIGTWHTATAGNYRHPAHSGWSCGPRKLRAPVLLTASPECPHSLLLVLAAGTCVDARSSPPLVSQPEGGIRDLRSLLRSL